MDLKIEDSSSTYAPDPSTVVHSMERVEESVQPTAANTLLVSPDSIQQQRLRCSGERHYQPMDTPPSFLCSSGCGEPTAGESVVRASSNAARERTRVRTLRRAFLELQRTLPAVPRDTKLSKLDVLVLATTYIAHLTSTLARSSEESGGHESSTKMSLTASDVHMDELLGGGEQASQLLALAPSTRRDAWRFGSCHRGMMVARRELSRFCGTAGASHGVKNNGISGLRSHGYLHPVKKWPMRTRLYAGIMASASGTRKHM